MRSLLFIAIVASATPSAADTNEKTTATSIEKLKLTIDFPGKLEVFDTDVTGKSKLPATEVRIESTTANVGTLHVSIAVYKDVEDAKRTIKIVSSDASNFVVTKLADKGWILTWQYNENKWYGVKALSKIKGKWVLMDARPEAQAAADIVVSAFKSMRAS